MKTLLSVAVVGLVLSLSGCGSNSTTIEGVSATVTPGIFIKGGACHYQDFEKGVDILYEDRNICFSHNPVPDVYMVRLPFVMTVGQYLEQKLIAEGKIDEKAAEHRCRIVWAPAMEVSVFLVQSDLRTHGCPLPSNR